MENIEEFNVADTMLWQKVKEGLTKKWLENEADTYDLDYLLEVYNDEYDGGIFDNQEDAIYDAFRDVYDAFDCGVNSQGNYDSCDSYFKVESYDNMLYSWGDYDMLDKFKDEMGSDIRYLAEDIEENKIDPDGTYIEIVKDITLTQRHYKKTLEDINADLFKYIDENTVEGFDVDDLKRDVGFNGDYTSFKIVPDTIKLTEAIGNRNAKIKELLNTNGAFLKGALYDIAITHKVASLDGILGEVYNWFNINDEFKETHKEAFDEVNLNLAKIGEFIQ